MSTESVCSGETMPPRQMPSSAVVVGAKRSVRRWVAVPRSGAATTSGGNSPRSSSSVRRDTARPPGKKKCPIAAGVLIHSERNTASFSRAGSSARKRHRSAQTSAISAPPPSCPMNTARSIGRLRGCTASKRITRLVNSDSDSKRPASLRLRQNAGGMTSSTWSLSSSSRSALSSRNSDRSRGTAAKSKSASTMRMRSARGRARCSASTGISRSCIHQSTSFTCAAFAVWRRNSRASKGTPTSMRSTFVPMARRFGSWASWPGRAIGTAPTKVASKRRRLVNFSGSSVLTEATPPTNVSSSSDMTSAALTI
mmetsp:Transcript_22709/g.70356  ORF Transcript_22709/g.70356 Transcript_22709/m.70356 type:complete len:311 (+) Transcript_22709:365-1297(+)